MEDAISRDFQWAGIAFRMMPLPGSGLNADAPALLEWRHPSGEAGSRRFARVSDAMQHSSRLTATVTVRRQMSV